jgi:hypothetical protein
MFLEQIPGESFGFGSCRFRSFSHLCRNSIIAESLNLSRSI